MDLSLLLSTEGDESVPGAREGEAGAAGGARRWRTLLVLFLPLLFVPGAETPPPVGAIDGRSGGAGRCPAAMASADEGGGAGGCR